MQAILIGGPADGNTVDVEENMTRVYVRQPMPLPIRCAQPMAPTAGTMPSPLRYEWLPVDGPGYIRYRTFFRYEALTDDEAIQLLLHHEY